MPAQPLSTAQKEDAKRLERLWIAYKQNTPGASQKKIAAFCGFKSQSSVSQYVNGDIPLNVPVLKKFCDFFKVQPSDISPRLAAEIAGFSDYTKSAKPSEIEELEEVVTRLTTSGKMQLTEVSAMIAMLKAREGH